ncbi:MAG: FlgD immunoglobulin-like domain containing protein [Candidatus Edwardsbacteria bacterium]|nr:FlgD immunoglobulin-like domain containing protein [Candidatus Edwardsbacteria bacterium]
MNRKSLTILVLALVLFCAAAVQAKPRETAKVMPFKAQPTAKATVDTVFFDNFETDTMGWDTMDMSFQTPKWHIDAYQAYSGYSWWCGTSTDTAGWSTPPGYGDGWAQFLISPDFDLTTISADSVIFSMWHYYNLEGPAFPDDWDCINVWADTTGDTLWHFDNWINITPDTLRFSGTAYNLSHPYAWTYTGLSPDGVPIYGWGGSNGGYTQVGFDLSRFKGKHLRLCFIGASDAAASDQTANMNYHGMWYLDNLQVDTVSAGGARGSIFFDDCESGPGDWKATGKTPKINWHRSARRASSGTTSWYCGSEATGKYSWGQSDAMVTPLIDLRPVSNSQPCMLDFKIWPDVPDDGSDSNGYNDWWRIDVSTDSGRNWLDFAGIFIDSSKQWKNHSDIWPLDLSGYIGKVIKIRIGMGSDGDSHVGEGLYVDDFIVTGKTREPLPPASTVLLVDNDGAAVDLSDNSWTKYFEASLAGLGYRYSAAAIGVNKQMPPGYLEQFPAVIWNLGADFDYRNGPAYYVLSSTNAQLLTAYLNAGGRLWMAGQYYFYGNPDTTAHPNLWTDYLRLSSNNGWYPTATLAVTGASGDPIGDGFMETMNYDRLNGGGLYWTDPGHAYTLNPDTPSVSGLTGFFKNDDSTYCGLRYWDGTPGGYKFVYTAFPFEAVGGIDQRDTLLSRIMAWLLPGAQDYDAPATPQGLSAVQEYDSVICRWRANSEPDLAGYRIYRSLQEGLPVWNLIGVATAPDTVFADTTIAPDKIYHYAVSAFDNAYPVNESAWSPWRFLRTVAWSRLGMEGAEGAGIPRHYELAQCRPNPMRDRCQIEFALPEPGSVKLVVYNVTGQRVRTLIHQNLSAGYHRVQWDGCGENGNRAANGVYLYRLEATRSAGGAFTQTRRLLLVK